MGAPKIEIDITLKNSIVKLTSQIEKLSSNIEKNNLALVKNSEITKTVSDTHNQASKSATILAGNFKNATKNIEDASKKTSNLVSKQGELVKKQKELNDSVESGNIAIRAIKGTISVTKKTFDIFKNVISGLIRTFHIAMDIVGQFSQVVETYPIVGKLAGLAVEYLAIKLAKVVAAKTDSKLLKIAIAFRELSSMARTFRTVFEKYPFIQEVIEGIAEKIGSTVLGESLRKSIQLVKKLHEVFIDFTKIGIFKIIAFSYTIYKLKNIVFDTMRSFANAIGIPVKYINLLESLFVAFVIKITKADEKIKSAISSTAKAFLAFTGVTISSGLALLGTKAALAITNKTLFALANTTHFLTRSIAKNTNSFTVFNAAMDIDTAINNKLIPVFSKLENRLKRVNKRIKILTGGFKQNIKTLKLGTLSIKSVIGSFGKAVFKTEVFERGLVGLTTQLGLLSGASSFVGITLLRSDSIMAKMAGGSMLALAAATGGLAVVIRSVIIATGGLVTAFGTNLVEAANDSIEKMNKLNDASFSFGFIINRLNAETKGAIGSLKEWNSVINKIRISTGYSNYELENSTSELLRVGNSIGLTRDQMKTLLPVITDLAAANHKDLFQSTLAVVEGLAGQTVMLQNMGVNLTKHALAESKAGHAMGERIKTLSEHEKIQLRYNTLLEKTTTVNGIAAASLMTVAGASRSAESSMNELQKSFGRGAEIIEGNFVFVVAKLYSSLTLIPPIFLEVAGTLTAVIGRLSQVTGVMISFSFTASLVISSIIALNTLLKDQIIANFIISLSKSNFILQTIGLRFPVLGKIISSTLFKIGAAGLNIRSIFGLLKATILSIGEVLITFAKGIFIAIKPLILPFVIIAAKIAAVIAAFVVLKNVIITLQERTQVFSSLWNTFKSIFTSSGESASFLAKTFRFLGNTMSWAWNAVVNFFGGIKDMAFKAFGLLAYAAASALSIIVKLVKFDPFGLLSEDAKKGLEKTSKDLKKFKNDLVRAGFEVGKLEKIIKKEIKDKASRHLSSLTLDKNAFKQMINSIKDVGKTQLQIIEEEKSKRLELLEIAKLKGAKEVNTEEKYNAIKLKIIKDHAIKKQKVELESLRATLEIEKRLRKNLTINTPVQRAKAEFEQNVQDIKALGVSPEKERRLLEQAETAYQKRISQIAINQERTTQETIAKIRKTYQKTTRLQSSRESHAQEKELIAKQLQSGEITQPQAKKREVENDKALAERRLDIELDAQKQIEKGLKGIQDRQASTLNQYTNIGTAINKGFDFSQDKDILSQERTLNKKLESGEITQEQFELEKESLNKAQKDLEKSSKIGFGAGLLSSVAKGADGAKDMLMGASTAALDMFIPGLGQAAGPLLDVFMQGPEATKKMVKDFAKAIPEIVVNLVEAVPVFIEELINQLPIMIQKLVDSVPALIDGLIESIPRLIDALVEAVPKIVMSLVDHFVSQAPFIGIKITEGLIKALPKVMTMFPKMGVSIVTGMVRKLGSVGSIFKKLFSFSGGKGKVEKFINLDFPAVKFAQGGLVGNRSFTRDSETHDKVPSMLSVGEVVLPKSIVNSGNIEELIMFMKKIGLSFQNFGFGGFVKKVKNKAKGAISSVSDSLSGDFSFAKDAFKNLIDGDISGLLGGFADNFFGKMDMMKGLMPTQLRELFDKIDPYGFIRELYESLKNIGFKLSISDIIKNPFDAIKKIIELNKQVLKPHFKKLIKPAKDEPAQAAKGGEVRGGITGVDSVPLLAQKGELVVDRGNNVKLTKFLNSSNQTTNNNNNGDMSLVVELLGQVVNLLGNPITVESDVTIDRDVLAKSILQLNRNNARLTV